MRATDLARLAITACFCVISAAYFYAALRRSIAPHLWMDEVLAVSAARQPTLAGVWQEIWQGTDYCPPTYHFLLHLVGRILPASLGDLVWRLPSILAVYGAALCVGALARSARNPCAALMSFGLALSLGLFNFAVQARPYALLTLAFAASLLVWSRGPEARFGRMRALCLWLLLSLCLILHFYGVIEVVVVAIAELAWSIGRRRMRVIVWFVFVMTLPVELLLAPLAAHLATFSNGDASAPDYYAKPGLSRFADALWTVVIGGGPGEVLIISVGAILGMAHLGGWITRQAGSVEGGLARDGLSASGESPFRFERLSIMLAVFTLPVLTFAMSFWVTKSFSGRYMAASGLLPAVVAAYALDWMTWRPLTLLLLVPLIIRILVNSADISDPVAEALAVLQPLGTSSPIVVGEALLYVELMDAADDRIRSSLVFLQRPPDIHGPDPTNENELVRMSRFHPEFHVIAQAVFLANHADFYVLARPDASPDATTPRLLALGRIGDPHAEGHVLLYHSIDQPIPGRNDAGQ